MRDVTLVLEAIRRGDAQAGEELLTLVYAELRQLARAKMAREQPGHTLQPTALDDVEIAAPSADDDELLGIHEALDRLAAFGGAPRDRRAFRDGGAGLGPRGFAAWPL